MKLDIVCARSVPTDHAELLKRNVLSRIPCDFSPDGTRISLTLDPSLPPESFRVDRDGAGWKVTGGDRRGVFFGIGKLLHSARWTDDAFFPAPTDGVVSPAGEFRAIYFSIHFYNWYQNAPEDELERYMEELFLWGYNTVIAIVPAVNSSGFGDPLFERGAGKAEKVFAAAKRLGMKTGLIAGANQGAKNAPREFDADPSYDPLGKRGHTGRNLCLNRPGAAEYMKKLHTEIFRLFSGVGLDYVITWPYDEGGCGCEKCRPWGARGYLDAVKLIRECARGFFPDAKYIVSTWFFDTPDSGEYEGLYRRLKGDLDWVDAIMVDDPFTPTPRYVLEHEPVKPVVNFPEISMWKLYPWGGFGANPMPERFQSFLRTAGDLIRGGMPYSEGIYEDVSKVQWIGYYWKPDGDWRDILREYFSYELCPEAADDALELCGCLERNHVAVGEEREPSLSDARRAGELARKIDALIPGRRRTGWRWRLIFIRAILDEKRHEYYFSHNCRGKDDLWRLRYYSGVYLARDPEAQSLFSELRELYHCSEFNGENRWTLPPLGGATVP